MYSPKKCFYLIVVFCFLIVPLSSQVWAEKKGEEEAQAPLSKQPHITFDATNYDAGEVWEGDVVTHDFAVQNTGTSELTISKVKPG